MGYHTEFRGEFYLNKPLTEAHAEYLKAFAGTRRMKRDPKIAETLPDPIRKAVGLPIGEQGEFFVGNSNDGDLGQTEDKSVLDYNNHPSTQPGLWCQWVPNSDGTAIEWDGGEKFYSYIEWINYIIKNFMKPWGYKLSGQVQWRGEDWCDMGKIDIKKNVVKVKENLTNSL